MRAFFVLFYTCSKQCKCSVFIYNDDHSSAVINRPVIKRLVIKRLVIKRPAIKRPVIKRLVIKRPRTCTFTPDPFHLSL